MKALAVRLLDLAAGPIQTRELRATFRGWRFMIVFTGALLGALLILWITAFSVMLDEQASSTVGSVTFLVLVTIQAGILSLLLPGFAGTSIVRERDQATLELLSTTTIRPVQVVWGQFAAAMGYVGVYLFATLPLIAFPYWFGGLVGWEPFVAYFVLFMYAGLIAIWSLYMSASSPGIARAVISSYVSVLAMGIPIGAALAQIVDMAGRGRSLSGMVQDLAEHPWAMLINGSYFFLAPFSFFFLAAVNRLSPPGSNRATPIRIYCLLALPSAAGFVLGNLLMWTATERFDERVEYAASFWFLIVFGGAVVAFQTLEGPIEGKRLLGNFKAMKGWRSMFRLLMPGGDRAWVITILLVVMTLAGGVLLLIDYLHDARNPLRAGGVASLVVFAQVLLAAGFGVFLGSLNWPQNVRRVVWVLGLLVVPIATSIWQLAAWNDFPDAMQWRMPGWLCMPFVLYQSWTGLCESTAIGRGPEGVIPEVGRHIPVWIPFCITHIAAGALLSLAGLSRVAARTRALLAAVPERT